MTTLLDQKQVNDERLHHGSKQLLKENKLFINMYWIELKNNLWNI